jgi:hypothetical protein
MPVLALHIDLDNSKMKHQHHNSRRWQYRNRLSVFLSFFLSFFLPSFMYSIGVVQCVPQLRTNGLKAREAETGGHSGLQAGEQLLSTSLPYVHVIRNHFTTANHRHIQGKMYTTRSVWLYHPLRMSYNSANGNIHA